MVISTQRLKGLTARKSGLFLIKSDGESIACQSWLLLFFFFLLCCYFSTVIIYIYTYLVL